MNAAGIERPEMQSFAGQDLHLGGSEFISYQPQPDKNILIFEGNFSLNVGDNTFTSDSAVVWLQSSRSEYHGGTNIEYYVQAYLEGNVSVKKGKAAATTNIATRDISGRSFIARFTVTGDVFATAEKRKVADAEQFRYL